MVFESGHPIPYYEPNSHDFDELRKTSIEIGGVEPQSLLQVLLFLSIIAAFLVMVISLVKMKDIRLILKIVLFFIVIPLFLVFLINLIPTSSKSIGSYVSPTGIETVPNNYNFAPSTTPPDFLFTIVGITLLLILAGSIILYLSKQKVESKKERTLAEEADTAIKAIEDGRSLDNVIIYCYMRMSEIIMEQRGIERKSYLTPREFEKQLVSEGISFVPIQQLTKLFEEIRYGKKSLDHQAQTIALSSLKEIRDYLQRATMVKK